MAKKRNVFKDTANRLKDSAWIIPIYGLFLASLYLGVNFWLEDFNANLAAYSMIPTNKVGGDDMVALMAIFIQIAPMVFSFLYVSGEGDNTWQVITAGIFLFTDWGIGTFYRGFGLDFGWVVYAAIEDLVFFTLGSEILITLSLGVLAAMFVPTIRAILSLVTTPLYEAKSALEKTRTSRNRKQQSRRPVSSNIPGESPAEKLRRLKQSQVQQ